MSALCHTQTVAVRVAAPAAAQRRARCGFAGVAVPVRSAAMRLAAPRAHSLRAQAAPATAAPSKVSKGLLKTSPGMTFTSYLLKSEMAGHIDNEMVVVLSSIATACKQIASLVQRAGISNMTGLAGAANVQGEDQKKLDVLSNDVFCAALSESGRTAIIASEEEDVPVAVEETFSGQYIVVFDPLDGSSNIDAAVSTGSIWGIYEPTRTCIAPGTADAATVQARPGGGGCARRGTAVEQARPANPSLLTHAAPPSAGELRGQRLPAGQQPAERGLLHVLLLRHPGCHHRQGGAYAPARLSTALLTLSSTSQVYGFTLDQQVGEFVLSHENIKIPESGKIYSFNEGNYAMWAPGLKKYMDSLKVRRSAALV
jgi:fructose-1,6-bisphosphatase I